MGIFDKNKNNHPTNNPLSSNQANAFKTNQINNPYQNPLMFDQQAKISQPGYGHPMYQHDQMQTHKPIKPNFSNKELDAVEIPNQIAKEIRSEKYRVVGLMFLGIIALGIASFFLILHFAINPAEDGTKLKIPAEWQPNPILMFILMFIGFIFLIVGLIDYSHIRIAVKKYRGDVLMGVEEIPYFLIRNYKALISRPIYLNWLAFNIYVWGGVVIGIFYIIKATSNLGMKTEILITITILCVTLFIHITSLIITRARKGNITAYYGYEIVPFEQIKDLSKKTNRTCMIIFFLFISIILLVIVIPYIIIRKNKGKPIIPFI